MAYRRACEPAAIKGSHGCAENRSREGFQEDVLWGDDVQLSFGEYALDVDRRELTRGSELILLGPHVFDLLVYLVENREHVVSKDDLLK